MPQYRIIDGLTVELTPDEIESVAQGGLTRVPAPERSQHDYVEIVVGDSEQRAERSVQCVLCDETSPTETAHEQHMEDVHARQ